ncbi:MAG: TMEM43 family protein [Planctomycetes bacterium]|nr:TMEM43 family protein [Planctomycetota bacterium]
MAFVEVTHKGWGSRLIESIKGVLFGLLLVVLSFPLLFWNEGRAVKTENSLAEGKSAVVSATPEKMDPANEGKLVHLTGEATTAQVLEDGDFGVSLNALRLRRSVEMFQWSEKKESKSDKKLGGGEDTVTTYTYRTGWSSSLENSSGFKEAGHNNPSTFRYGELTREADRVTLGAYTLSRSLQGRIDKFDALPVTEGMAERLPDGAKRERSAGRLQLVDGKYYVGVEAGAPATPNSPKVGDERVSFSAVKPLTVSLVSQQVGNTFQPFKTSQEGYDVELLSVGSRTAEAMFASAEAGNVAMTWILRFVGWLLMAFGIGLIFAPVAVLGDVVPIFGSLLGAGIGVFAIALSFGLSLITIAIAWFVYRPVLAVLLLALAGGAFYALSRQAGKARAAKGAPGGA